MISRQQLAEKMGAYKLAVAMLQRTAIGTPGRTLLWQLVRRQRAEINDLLDSTIADARRNFCERN
jgi:hypothetical protein